MPVLLYSYGHMREFFSDRLKIPDAPNDIVAKELAAFAWQARVLSAHER